MSQFFATDKINSNTTNTGQTFSQDGDGNLVITETFQTVLSPNQAAIVQQSLQDQINTVQEQSTVQISNLQLLLDNITNNL